MPVEFEVSVCALTAEPLNAKTQANEERTHFFKLDIFIIRLQISFQPIPLIEERRIAVDYPLRAGLHQKPERGCCYCFIYPALDEHFYKTGAIYCQFNNKHIVNVTIYTFTKCEPVYKFHTVQIQSRVA